MNYEHRHDIARHGDISLPFPTLGNSYASCSDVSSYYIKSLREHPSSLN
jgi:hypothetical protein